MLEASVLVVFPFCMIFAMISDLFTMQIPNRIALVLVSSFAFLAPLSGMEWSEYFSHFLAGGIVLMMTFLFFAAGFCGGGDAKLLSAIALWTGFNQTLLTHIVLTSFAGFLLCLFVLAYRSSIFPFFLENNIFFRNIGKDTKVIPYGIAIGVAGLFIYFDSPLGQWVLWRLT